MRRSSLSVRVLQGFFVLAVGVVLILVNLGSLTSPFQKVTGHITQSYVETTAGAYTASDLVIDSSNDIFIFNKNNFSPVWNDTIYKGQRIDIYYRDGTPKKVVAITLYNFSDEPITTFATSDYNGAHKGSSSLPIGIIIGGIIALIGYLLLMRCLWLFVRARLRAKAKPQVG